MLKYFKDAKKRRKEMQKIGKKYDDGKPKVGMVFSYFAKPLLAVAEVGTYGWKKYANDKFWDSNWWAVENGRERYLDAAMRHLLAYMSGETRDAESGHHHVHHATWDLLAVIYFIMEEEKNEQRQNNSTR